MSPPLQPYAISMELTTRKICLYRIISPSFLIVFVITKIFKGSNQIYDTGNHRREVTRLIDYGPFWQTLENSDENWYTLTTKHHLSHSPLHRLKHNKDISTKTINDLCRILNRPVESILRYILSESDQTL